MQLVERYRAEHGISDAADALGARPKNLLAQIAWRDVSRTLERTRRELSISQPTHATRPSLEYERQ